MAATDPWPPGPLPPGLAARVRAAALAGPSGPPAPGGAAPVARPAATVVLLQDGAAGLEVYLLRRVAGMAFAAGMSVFPGGAVDPRDGQAPPGWCGPEPAAWARVLSADPPLVAALVAAAVRETFEETGVLLAGPDPDRVLADTGGAGWERDRQALVAGQLSLAGLLRRRGLLLRADLLVPWAHWVTPEFEERRYDTRFFLAALPAGQRPRDVGGEADRVHWVRPAEALAGWRRGELGLLPPTARTLADLTAYDRVAAALAAGAGRSIQPMLPRAVLVDGEARLVLPGEPGYPA
ncbi:MAG: NUDIX hydrolase [Actinomycetota bacterium]